MTTILKKGVDPFAGRELTCPCGCVFQLEGSKDVRRNYYEPDICLVSCPTCGKILSFVDHSS